MIIYEDLYLDFISQRGVGSKDVVASSPASYVSYLRSVCQLIGADISPGTLRSEVDVRSIAKRIEGKKAEKTIRNYCSAMRLYVAMVEAKKL